ERVDRLGVRAELVHGPPVQLEMADVTAVDVLVGFLGEHDFHDEPAVVGMSCRAPGQGHRGHLTLEPLQQGEEVPYREHVVLHEYPNAVLGVEFQVERMADQLSANAMERVRIHGFSTSCTLCPSTGRSGISSRTF